MPNWARLLARVTHQPGALGEAGAVLHVNVLELVTHPILPLQTQEALVIVNLVGAQRAYGTRFDALIAITALVADYGTRGHKLGVGEDAPEPQPRPKLWVDYEALLAEAADSAHLGHALLAQQVGLQLSPVT